MKMAVFSLLLWMLPSFLASAKPVAVAKPQVKPPKLFILAIGINKYSDSMFPELKWAENDARKFADGIGLGNGYEINKQILTGAAVTKETIRKATDNIARLASGRDAVIIYLSGHGSLKVGESGDLEPVFVLAATAANTLATSSLSQKALLSQIAGIKARKKTIITASCHSGVGKSRLTPRVKEILAQAKGIPALEKVSEGILILSAAAKNEVAIEDNSFQSDIYTHFFLQALGVYDRNQDGAVSVLEAHDYATEKSFVFSKGKQRPTIQAEVIGNIDIPLKGKRNKKALPVLEGYDEQFAGLEVEVNQQEKGRLPFAFPLLPGKNQVILYSQNREKKIASYSMEAKSGQTLTVEDMVGGHPFALGPYFAHILPTGRAYEKIVGDNGLTTGLLGSWRKGRIILGANFQMPSDFKSQLLGGLTVKATESMASFNPGFRLIDAGKFTMATHAVLGQDRMELKITDDSTGYTESASSSSGLIGAGLNLAWSPLDLMIVSLGAEYQKIEHDFGRLGKVDATRRIALLSLKFTFGGVARRW